MINRSACCAGVVPVKRRRKTKGKTGTQRWQACQRRRDEVSSEVIPQLNRGWFVDLLLRGPSPRERVSENLRYLKSRTRTRSAAERMRACRQRVKEKRIDEEEPINEFDNLWRFTNAEWKHRFTSNTFCHRCDICYRLWYINDLKQVTVPMAHYLRAEFSEEETKNFKLCRTCFIPCRKNKIPAMSRTNGYTFPPTPSHLRPLDLLSERLVSPRIPYMQIRRLRRIGDYSITGQVHNQRFRRG